MISKSSQKNIRQPSISGGNNMPSKRNYLHIKNEEGSGLILALMTLMVLAVLGASLGAITIGSFKLGNVNRDDTSAYYIAEAGANMAYEEMKVDVMGVHEQDMPENSFYHTLNGVLKAVDPKIEDPYSSYTFEEQFGEQPTATVTIEVVSDSNPRSYIINSTGEVDGKTRTVSKPVDVSWVGKDNQTNFPPLPENAAIISQDSMNLGKVNITGDIYISAHDSLSVKNKTVIQGETVVHSLNWSLYSQLINKFPDISTLESQDQPTSVNTEKGNEKSIVLDTLDLSKELNVQGEGTLNIYVKNNIRFGNKQSFNVNGASKRVKIFYNGVNDINISNHVEINASLFIKQAGLSTQPNSTLTGFVFTGGSVDINGNRDNENSLFLFAPNDEITVGNHADIKGTLIGKEVNITNQSTITYQNVSEFPFNFNSNNSDDNSYDDIISTEPAVEPN